MGIPYGAGIGEYITLALSPASVSGRASPTSMNNASGDKKQLFVQLLTGRTEVECMTFKSGGNGFDSC